MICTYKYDTPYLLPTTWTIINRLGSITSAGNNRDYLPRPVITVEHFRRKRLPPKRFSPHDRRQGFAVTFLARGQEKTYETRRSIRKHKLTHKIIEGRKITIAIRVSSSICKFTQLRWHLTSKIQINLDHDIVDTANFRAEHSELDLAQTSRPKNTSRAYIRVVKGWSVKSLVHLSIFDLLIQTAGIL